MTIKEMLDERQKNGESRGRAQIEVGKKIKATIKAGYSSKEIAEEFGLTEEVVQKIKENIAAGK